MILFGFGFVDDTTLITWSDSAEVNCRRLTQAHEKCEAWAKRYGAKFAPDKYQLIHFTKRRKNVDLTPTVTISGHEAELVTSLRVLGVWLDPTLSWKDHIEKATAKGIAAFDSMARITASTWGPSVRRSRLLYSAVARPIMTYGSQIWSINENGSPIAPSRTAELEKVQNKCPPTNPGGVQENPSGSARERIRNPPSENLS